MYYVLLTYHKVFPDMIELSDKIYFFQQPF